MQFIKTKSDLKRLICFDFHEFVSLIYFPSLNNIQNLVIKNKDHNELLPEKVKDLAINETKSKKYEYYVAILDLYNQFEKECCFCFNLKDKFNPRVDEINSLESLEKWKEDPPDIIIKDKEGLHNFELKKYQGKLDEQKIVEYIIKKVARYSDNQLNYYIVLQSKFGSVLDFKLFEQVHKDLCKFKMNLGKIALRFNLDNESHMIVIVYPELEFIKLQMVSNEEILKVIQLY